MAHRMVVVLALVLGACEDTSPSVTADGGEMDAIHVTGPDASLADAAQPDDTTDSGPSLDAPLPDATPPENANCGHAGQVCCTGQAGPVGDVCANATSCCYPEAECFGLACEQCGGVDERCCHAEPQCDPGLTCATIASGSFCRDL